MDPLREPVQCRVGDMVYTADNHKLGKVVAYDARFLTVEKGLLRKHDYYVPMSAVNSCNEGQVYLDVAEADIRAQAWDAPPPMPTDAEGNPLAH